MKLYTLLLIMLNAMLTLGRTQMPPLHATTHFTSIDGPNAAALMAKAIKAGVTKDRNLDENQDQDDQENLDDFVSTCPACEPLNVLPYEDVFPFPEDPEDPDPLDCLTLSFAFDPASFYWPLMPSCTYYRDFIAPLCCDASSFKPSYECESNIKQNITSGYDTTVPPKPAFGKPVEVHTLFRFFLIADINLQSSTATIFFHVVMRWNDPRLSWETDSDKCSYKTSIRASFDAELTEIWVPHLDLSNKKDGFQSYDENPATVHSDGTVVWERYGTLSPYCSFVGLRRIPFDTIGCQLMFEATERPLDATYILMDTSVFSGDIGVDGIVFPPYNQTYSEYKVVKEKTETYYTDPITKAYFAVDLYFSRASTYYRNFIIFPTIMFVFMSFGQFLVDFDSGDRLSIAVNSLLILVAQNIIVQSVLPICQESLWINSFNFASLIFILVALAETVFLLYFYKEQKKIDAKRENRQNLAGMDLNNESQVLDEDDRQQQAFLSLMDNGKSPDGVSLSNDDSVEKATEEQVKEKQQNAYVSRMNHFGNALQAKVVKYSAWIDTIFVWGLFISYSLYIIIMYATNKKWDDDADDVWAKEL